jgi:hypothetical protein
MKNACVALLACSVLLLLGAGILGAQESEMNLCPEAFGKHERPCVQFNHEQHMAAVKDECKDCHHVSRGGQLVYEEGEEKPCAECHKVKDQGKMPGLMHAFHKNCQGCHKEDRKKGEKTGPVTCGGCHVKAKK